MWIRSQNGTKLIKVSSVWVEGTDLVTEPPGPGWAAPMQLGNFESKSDALAELDTITRWIADGGKEVWQVGQP